MDLPQPSAFRELRPAILGPPLGSDTSRFFERKGVVVGFGAAVAFHICVGLAWWLTPPLRLKTDYAPERWMPVASIPLPTTAAPPLVAAPPLTAAPPSIVVPLITVSPPVTVVPMTPRKSHAGATPE